MLIYQANMPFVKMDELARAAVKVVTYLFYQDTERVTTSGPSGVHDVVIEVSLFGPLEEIDRMGQVLNDVLLHRDVESGNWVFALSMKDKKDIWEPNIKSKRIWLQYKGLMLNEE